MKDQIFKTLFLFDIAILFMFLNHNVSNAQSVIGDFDDPSCQRGTSYCPFRSSCDLQGWKQSHGDPSIQKLLGSSNTTPYVYMFSRGNEGEGIFVDRMFQRDVRYILTFQTITGVQRLDNFFIKLANGLQENANCSDYSFPNVSGVQQQQVYRKTNYLNDVVFGGGDWETHTVLFVPNRDYSQLWIYPKKNSNGGPDQIISVDNISLQTISPTDCNYDPLFRVIKKTTCGGYPSRHPHWRFRINNPEQNVSYTWGGNNITYNGSNTGSYVVGRPTASGYFTATVTANRNGCSNSSTTFSRTYHTSYDCDAPFSFNISPNPSTESIEIKINETGEKEFLITKPDNVKYEIRVYDKLNNTIYQESINEESQVIDTRKFPRGMLFIQVSSEKYEMVERIIIN